jgi:glycosyltransferase involved in cell wall biosynthesis
MIKLSVITINYNNREGLEKTIKSVLAQSFTDFEYLIIDGGSTDGSVDVIKKEEKRINYWVSEEDSGIYNAMNKAIKKATGEYCLFLNSGDYLKDATVLEEVFKAQRNSDAAILYGNLLIDHGKGKLERSEMPSKLSVYQFMVSTLWHPVSFIRRELFQKYGVYDESFKIAADYDFFVKVILRHGVKTHYLPFTITVFNTEGIGSSDTYRDLQEEERHKSLSNNLSPLLLEMAGDYTKIVRSSSYKLSDKLITIIKKLRLK